MGAWYNPYSGAYGRGYGAYGPYGGVGMGASYNPRTGTYARGAAAYGPYGSRAAGQAYNPRTGTYAQTRQGSNVYGNWGTSSVQRGDNWAQTAHRENYRTGQTTSGIRTSEGGGAVARTGPDGRTTVARTGSGDVYAGRDGNVYRRTEGGGWNKATGLAAGLRPKGIAPTQGATADVSRPCPERPFPECDSSNEPARTRPRRALGRQYQDHDSQQLGIERFVEIGSGQLSGWWRTSRRRAKALRFRAQVFDRRQ